jgi:gentisate 1,2-dioxygenase
VDETGQAPHSQRSGHDDMADLVADMGASNLQPLWDRYRRLVTREPKPTDPPMLWRWSELQTFVQRAAQTVAMADAERRVLILANPAFRGEAVTTHNLIGALQILEPGESADAHRHSAAAVRLVLEGDGADTFVDGVPYAMHPGDLILTPAWTWHSHANTTNGRVVWFDGLDVPLARFGLDALFFEPHAPSRVQPPPAWRWTADGLHGAGGPADLPPYSPRLRYPWTETIAALDGQGAAPDGTSLVRFVNTATGGAVLPTLDCSVMRVGDAAGSVWRRSTFNTICVVIDGEGRSVVGDESFGWRTHDIFTVPHWTWARHTSLSPRAHLFLFTDRELYRRLHLLREETRT